MARAWNRFQSAVYDADPDALATGERELDQIEADLARARGRLLHARFIRQGAVDRGELEELEAAPGSIAASATPAAKARHSSGLEPSIRLCRTTTGWRPRRCSKRIS